MPRVLIAGYQHETNTFAPSLADWSAFTSGEAFPPYLRGQAVIEKLCGINIPVAGFIDAARRHGWQLVPSCWAGAVPSSYVTKAAFERIAGDLLQDVAAALPKGLDAIYLDLHGAAVAEHALDSEGELLARLRALVGPDLPIVASLDLHANVTRRMLALTDALVAYRTYPHVDMADTGELAAQLLVRRWRAGQREPLHWRRLPFLIALNAQSTFTEPGQSVYQELKALDAQTGVCLSFCPGFPASDFDECAPMVWGYGERAQAVVEQLYQRVSAPAQWRVEVLSARDAVAQALTLAENAAKPVVIADTQDNPGAGGDSNTTGMLHALLAQGAGQRFPGQVALGLLFDPEAGRAAHAAGLGAEINLPLGKSVPTFSGASDPPLQARFKVTALSDGVCTLKGPMMTGVTTQLGACAALETQGLRIAVVGGKAQLLDRELLRMVGVHAEQMRIVVAKSSVHFRADFQPNASHILVAKAAGPMAADPSDLPWQRLDPGVRVRP